MRALWRLASWGTAAAVSLLIAVLAGFSETASQHSMARAAPDPATLAREFDVATRRLAESVRTLTADRDRLAARLGTLERSVEDITGSVRRQAAAPAAAPGTGAAPPAASAPAAAAPAASAPPKEAAVAPERLPKIPAGPPASAVERQGGAAEPAAPPAAAGDPEAHAPAAKLELGADIGGAMSFDGVRALWASLKSAHAEALEGLQPIVKARENGKAKSVELRLIAGPLPTAKAVARLCAVLKRAKRSCHRVEFEGQRLAEADPAQESKANPTARSTPQPAQKPGWPFR
jgi:hypothetical protein